MKFKHGQELPDMSLLMLDKHRSFNVSNSDICTFNTRRNHTFKEIYKNLVQETPPTEVWCHKDHNKVGHQNPLCDSKFTTYHTWSHKTCISYKVNFLSEKRTLAMLVFRTVNSLLQWIRWLPWHYSQYFPLPIRFSRSLLTSICVNWHIWHSNTEKHAFVSRYL